MIHPILESLGSLRLSSDDDLERAVGALIMEATLSGFEPYQAARAEALAILSHEFRRRADRGMEG